MRRTIVSFALAVAACAQYPTRIIDRLYAGTVPFEGRLIIIGPDMTTQSGRTVVRFKREIQVKGGYVELELEPNDTATPQGTYYVVQYFPAKGLAWSEQWVVPTSTVPLQVHQVRKFQSGGPWPAPPGGVGQLNFADAEVPIGVIDGQNRQFHVTFQPNPPSSLILTRNGLVMKRGLDYVLADQTVTFIEEQTPQVGDILLAWYRY